MLDISVKCVYSQQQRYMETNTGNQVRLKQCLYRYVSSNLLFKI